MKLRTLPLAVAHSQCSVLNRLSRKVLPTDPETGEKGPKLTKILCAGNKTTIAEVEATPAPFVREPTKIHEVPAA